MRGGWGWARGGQVGPSNTFFLPLFSWIFISSGGAAVWPKESMAAAVWREAASPTRPFDWAPCGAERRCWRQRRHVRRGFGRAGSPRRRAGACRGLVLAEFLVPGRRRLTNIRAEPGSSRMRTATFWLSCNTCAQAARAHVVGGDIFAGVCCTASVCRLAELIRNAAPCISSFWLCARRRISAGSSQGGACDGLHAACVRCVRARGDRASHAGPVRVPTVPGMSSWLPCCARVRGSWRKASADLPFVHPNGPWLILSSVLVRH